MAGATEVNPYLKSMLEANDTRIANRVNSTMSGMGRYGSGSHTDVLARSLAESDNPVLANAFESGQNRALSAAQAIDTARRGADATGLSAWQQAAGIRQNDTGLGLNAAGGLNQNVANRINSAIGSLSTECRRRQRLGWAGLAPQLNALRTIRPRITAVGALQAARRPSNRAAEHAVDAAQRYLGAVTPFNPVFASATDSTKRLQRRTPSWIT